MRGTGTAQGRSVWITPVGYEKMVARLHRGCPSIATDENGNHFYQVYKSTLKGRPGGGVLTWVDLETWKKLN